MTDVAIARALHVLAVVLWIGGAGLVTTVMLPALRRMPDPVQRLEMFEAVEHRFGRQARISILVVGLTGLYMLWRLGLWGLFTSLPFWWLHAMVFVWLIFAAMLFVVEPFVLRRRLEARAARDSDGTFRRLHYLHVVLLILSLLTILGAVAGSHGALLFT